MGKQRPQPVKGKSQDSSVDAKLEYTTFRILAGDGEDLSELANKRGTSIAKLYHELFSASVRELLIAETETRLRRLRDRD